MNKNNQDKGKHRQRIGSKHNKQNKIPSKKEDLVLFGILGIIILGILGGYFLYDSKNNNNFNGETDNIIDTSGDKSTVENLDQTNEDETTLTGGNGGQTAGRTVLIETFTSVECYWCNLEEEPALKKIAEDYNSGEVIIIAYHGFYGNDPYETEKGNRRAGYYGGVSGTPTVWVDGLLSKVGANGNGVNALYSDYVGFIEKRTPIKSPLTLSLTGSIVGSTINVDLTIDAAENLDSSNLKVRFAVLEDGITHNGKIFDWVMRDIKDRALESNDLEGLISESLEIGSGWNSGNLRVVSWVQDDTTKEVHQAVYFDLSR